MHTKDSANFLSDLYVTIGQAAILLAVNRATIRRWIKEGKLTGEQIGKITLIPKVALWAINYQRETKK